jgi:hypothetical protein
MVRCDRTGGAVAPKGTIEEPFRPTAAGDESALDELVTQMGTSPPALPPPSRRELLAVVGWRSGGRRR